MRDRKAYRLGADIGDAYVFLSRVYTKDKGV